MAFKVVKNSLALDEIQKALTVNAQKLITNAEPDN